MGPFIICPAGRSVVVRCRLYLTLNESTNSWTIATRVVVTPLRPNSFASQLRPARVIVSASPTWKRDQIRLPVWQPANLSRHHWDASMPLAYWPAWRQNHHFVSRTPLALPTRPQMNTIVATGRCWPRSSDITYSARPAGARCRMSG